MLKQIQLSLGLAALIGAGSLASPHATAQISSEEFQMGRAREACATQAQQQLLTVNNVVSTTPVTGSGGRMIGSEVILNVSRGGETYDVRCSFDNATRTATIASIPSTGSGSGTTASRPASGTFQGRGVAHGATFTRGRTANVALTIEGDNFGLELAEPAPTGARVQYRGVIMRRSDDAANSFTLRTRVRSFNSSGNLRVLNTTTGTCQIEVFDARVISSNCNTATSDSSTRFLGLEQF
ncbi:MAG: hypothetical protein EDM05_009385 [Leptolyngbya sp. IPPAS B-1204]|nr:hypothetical protein [Elainella sp. C42_A2020_010]RNJ66490.1 MAG: hypothetical protein EDM05_25425 [Leptolyngbya sp. IPPAS B-1204]